MEVAFSAPISNAIQFPIALMDKMKRVVLFNVRTKKVCTYHKEVATKYFPPFSLEIKSLLVGVSKLINWCVGVLFLQRVYGI